MLLENQPGGGEQDSFSPTLKKIHPQGGLEVAQLLGDIWLGNAEAIGRTTETSGLCHGKEVAQVTNLKRVVDHFFVKLARNLLE